MTAQLLKIRREIGQAICLVDEIKRIENGTAGFVWPWTRRLRLDQLWKRLDNALILTGEVANADTHTNS